MKFLPAEYTAVKAAIETSGLPYTSFSFVKRRGRLHIQYQDQPGTFVFFRKSGTHLDESKQWKKTTTYHVGIGAGQQEFETWSEVLREFSTWLASL